MNSNLAHIQPIMPIDNPFGRFSLKQHRPTTDLHFFHQADDFLKLFGIIRLVKPEIKAINVYRSLQKGILCWIFSNDFLLWEFVRTIWNVYTIKWSQCNFCVFFFGYTIFTSFLLFHRLKSQDTETWSEASSIGNGEENE